MHDIYFYRNFCAIARRFDKLQDKYEEQNSRFDKVLDKYEKQNKRFDALLDKWGKEKAIKK